MAALISLSCLSKSTQTSANDRSLAELIKSQQPVYFEDIIFEDEIDFTTFLKRNLIAENTYQVDINSSITFKNCVFKKKVSAYNVSGEETVLSIFHSNVSFIECRFYDVVNVRAANIFGRLDFSKSKFYDAAVFEEISCQQNAYFLDGYFDKEVRFQNSYFAQKANFMNAQFNAPVSFQNSTFNAEAQFSVCKFYGYTDFSLIDCRANIFFNYADFQDRAILSNAVFARDINFASTKNKMTSFDKSRFFGKAEFAKITVSEKISFQQCFFQFNQPLLDFLSAEKVILTD